MVLHGVEGIPTRQAYQWVAKRSKARVFIDSSKVTNWPQQSTAAVQNADIRLIHLIRDPRGWLASQLRRDPGADAEHKLGSWVEENAQVRNYIETSKMRSTHVFYEGAVSCPDQHIRAAFSFLGLRHEASALRYWEHEHHGFAANGAASMVLKRPEHFKAEIFLTGDDNYYRSTRRRQSLDQRWRSELSPQIQRVALEHRSVAYELARYNRRMTEDGVVAV